MSVVFLVATALGLPVHLHRRGDHHHALSEHSHLRDLESETAHHHHHARSKHPHFRSLESEAHGLPSETMTSRQRAEKNLHGLAVFLSLHAAEQRGEDLERFVPTADADFERLDDHELKSTELELLRSFYLDALAAKVRPHHAWADLEKADPDEYHRELKRVETSAHIPKHLSRAELREWFLDAERDGVFDGLQAAMTSLTDMIARIPGSSWFTQHITGFNTKLKGALSTASSKLTEVAKEVVKQGIETVKDTIDKVKESAIAAHEWVKTVPDRVAQGVTDAWNFMWAYLSIFERKIMRRARHMAEAEVVR